MLPIFIMCNVHTVDNMGIQQRSRIFAHLASVVEKTMPQGMKIEVNNRN